MTKGLSWGWLWRAREAGDWSEGLDEDRSKDGDEGRDDVVGKSVSTNGEGERGIRISNRGEGAFLGRRVYILRRVEVGFALGCSSWREGRSEIVDEEMGATEWSVSKLGATEEEGVESVVGGGIRREGLVT